MEFMEPPSVFDIPDEAMEVVTADANDSDENSWVRTMTSPPPPTTSSTPIDLKKKIKSSISANSPLKKISSPFKKTSSCPPSSSAAAAADSNRQQLTSPPQYSKNKTSSATKDPFGDDNHNEIWVPKSMESRQEDPFLDGVRMDHLTIDNDTRQVNRSCTPKNRRIRTNSCENYYNSPPPQSRKSISFSKSKSSSIVSKAKAMTSPISSSGGSKFGRKKKAALLENLGEVNRIGPPGDDDDDIIKKPENIGLRLALPEARRIMTGHDPIPKPAPVCTTNVLAVRRYDEATGNNPVGVIENEIVIRTSEKDPYPHQVMISNPSDLLFHAKLCHLLEQYCDSIINHSKPSDIFDLTTLVGKSNEELEQMHIYLLRTKQGASSSSSNHASVGGRASPHLQLSSTESNGSSGGGGGVFSPIKKCGSASRSKSPVTKKKVPTLKRLPVPHSSVVGNEPPPAFLGNLFSCASDIVVEGRFHGSGDKTFDLGVEVTVFSSQKHRQFVVCYRGTPEQQAKPIIIRSDSTQKKIETKLLHPDHPSVQVNATFRDSYFFGNLEQNVFRLLNNLSQNDPFCDVVFTGHSFGGALATIGAVRYAATHSSMTVSCHVFGSPKIGSTNHFKFLANSLPNLRIFRLEYGTDPFVKAPSSSSSDQDWTHVGHTITLQEEPLTNLSPASVASAQAIMRRQQQTNSAVAAADSPPSSHRSGRSVMPAPTTTPAPSSISVAAYRFDEGKQSIKSSSSSSSLSSWSSSLNSTKLKKMKKDHELSSYVNALRPFAFGMKHWLTGYAGQDGKGVKGHNNEERCVV